MISFKAASPGAAALNLETSDGWFPTAQGSDRPVAQRAALKISAFYRAVDLRSDSIGRLPIAIKRQDTRRELNDHYLGQVLWGRPNEAMTPFVYKKLVEYKRLVLGNSYVWIYRDRHGRPVELLPLPEGTCRPYIEPGTGRLWYIIQNPKTQEMFRVWPEDILHYKGLSTNGITGLSLLSQAARTLRVAESRDAYEAAYYRNGGHPSGVLKTEADLSGKATQVDDEGNAVSYKDIIRREWDRIHPGPDTSMRVAVLDNGLTYTPIAMSNSDAQFVESKSVSVADIARFCGVPLYLLFSGKESYQSNSQNSTEYIKYSLQPTVTQYEEEDMKLLTVTERAQGLFLQRNMMAELRADSVSRKEWYQGMRDIGAMSVNEIRELEDMEPVAGGDQLYASLNYVPLEEWAELSRARAAKEGKGGGESDG